MSVRHKYSGGSQVWRWEGRNGSENARRQSFHKHKKGSHESPSAGKKGQKVHMCQKVGRVKLSMCVPSVSHHYLSFFLSFSTLFGRDGLLGLWKEPLVSFEREAFVSFPFPFSLPSHRLFFHRCDPWFRVLSLLDDNPSGDWWRRKQLWPLHLSSRICLYG